jgi:dTMP kinase
MKKGFFITLEGIEGVGKTTQIKFLEDFFKKQNLSFISTREPGGIKASEKIREIILNDDINDITEIFLYEASRSEHFIKVIKPALDENKIVICDRFTDSSLAYQGYGRGIDLKLINYLNDIATYGKKPNLTFILDLSVKESIKRITDRRKPFDRLESESFEFFTRVRNGFLEIAENDKSRVKVLDGNLEIEKIHLNIKEELKKHI